MGLYPTANSEVTSSTKKKNMFRAPWCRFKPSYIKVILLGLFSAFTYRMSVSYHAHTRASTTYDGNAVARQSRCANCSRCVWPVLELWPGNTSETYVKPTPISCAPAEENWVWVERGEFTVSPAAVERHGEVRCQYTPLKRRDDFHVDWDKTVAYMKSGTPISSDFFMANCSASDGDNYVNVHAGIVPVNQTTTEPPEGLQNTLPLNILMVGFDSVSRIRWMRSLPRTYDYLVKSLGAVVLEGYNIVGDGTPAALLPILTGKHEEELPEARRNHKGATTVDGHPWIWKEFKKHGYVTQFAEDRCNMGTFNYRMLGFKDQPVDHYMRHYFLQTENRGWRSSRSDAFSCTGSLRRHDIFLNYARDLFRTYPRRARKFSFMFHAELSHGERVLIQAMDDGIVDFLTEMNTSGYLDDTLLILMSDHGPRFSSDRATVQG